MITVVIDVRERDLWDLLQPWIVENTDGWTVVKRPLDVGDIAFFQCSEEIPQVVLERKSADDLGASLADGRYREQRARLLSLRGQGSSIGYIVEVPPWSPSLSRTWCRGTFSEVQVQHTMIRLQFRYTIPVFQAASLQETVYWIRRIAKQLVTDPTAFRTGLSEDRIQVAAAYKDAIHTKKASNTTQEIVFQTMLQTIPGLGKSAVEAIAALTQSSFQTLLFMTEDELAAVDTGKRKLGPKMAAALHTFLHS
jgi:ERCC4-type nuclease